jgi:hypothetical protein
MTSFDPASIMQVAGYGIFILFIFFGAKLQLMQMLAAIKGKMARLAILRDTSYNNLRSHISKFVALSADNNARLHNLITSIAIPPVSHLDPAGIVPKMENIFKTYDKYMKSNLRRIVNHPGVEPISQSDLENLTNSLEVAVELDTFYRVVDHYYRLAKKGGVFMAYQLVMVLPMLMEMGEALLAASSHFGTGLPIGDGFGPMVARQFVKNGDGMLEAENHSTDSETSVYEQIVAERRVFVVKAKGPGGSVGNPGKVTQEIILKEKPSLVVTIDAALRMESEKTGDVAEGVGVAMGGPGMDRFRIEEALAESSVPVLTVVCKMNMKEAISMMPKVVLDQVEPVYRRVLQLIDENSEKGQTVIVIGVGNTMGVE